MLHVDGISSAHPLGPSALLPAAGGVATPSPASPSVRSSHLVAAHPRGPARHGCSSCADAAPWQRDNVCGAADDMSTQWPTTVNSGRSLGGARLAQAHGGSPEAGRRVLEQAPGVLALRAAVEFCTVRRLLLLLLLQLC